MKRYNNFSSNTFDFETVTESVTYVTILSDIIVSTKTHHQKANDAFLRKPAERTFQKVENQLGKVRPG